MNISILTICLNGEKEIEETMRSVLRQSFTDFEYLIKDGGSTDKTLSIANTLLPEFEAKGIALRIVSQKDTGIYDAMNQAVEASTGDWMLFLNAGDRLAGDDVLERVIRSGALSRAEIVYGDTILQDNGLCRYSKALDVTEIRHRMPFCHQSVLTKRLPETVLFPTEYRICGDYFFYLKMYLEKHPFEYLPMPISIFDINGASENTALLLWEKIAILESMPIRDEESVSKLMEQHKRAKRAVLVRTLARSLIPESYRKKRRIRIQHENGWKPEKELLESIRGKE